MAQVSVPPLLITTPVKAPPDHWVFLPIVIPTVTIGTTPALVKSSSILFNMALVLFCATSKSNSNCTWSKTWGRYCNVRRIHCRDCSFSSGAATVLYSWVATFLRPASWSDWWTIPIGSGLSPIFNKLPNISWSAWESCGYSSFRVWDRLSMFISHHWT